MLWTTKYIDAAVAQLRAGGHEIHDEDIARLSPLKHRNPNLLGRYSFTAGVPGVGALRPLRDPDAPELDEDDDGGEPDWRPTPVDVGLRDGDIHTPTYPRAGSLTRPGPSPGALTRRVLRAISRWSVCPRQAARCCCR
ncbi:Tn3 family transposase [Streptomyces shenzhenensis]|uniref:Tn3 family transposase n=1 Tax=Streptomyces shenzhenensis TaxID=943815 RepID=UPI00367D6808